MRSEKIFAVCSPGLESILRAELSDLGIPLPAAPAIPGGVEFEGGPDSVYRANLWLRTASRITVRLGEFLAVGFPELIRKAHNLEWGRFLNPSLPVKLSVTCRSSRLYHSGAVAERVQLAIREKMGTVLFIEGKSDQSGVEDRGKSPDEQREPSPKDEPAQIPQASDVQLIIVRIHKDICTISVDSSGELLHRRGYRQETAKAPLRETLAAAMILASKWDLKSPLMDPFCGSGTIPIEAGLMARRIPAGRNRGFSFMKWPEFDRTLWEKMLSEADSAKKGDCPYLFGSDRDEGAVAAASRNAARAGLEGSIQFERKSVSELEPHSFPDFAGTPGWIVANPPYGVRVSAKNDLRNLYSRFGQVLREKFGGWNTGVLSTDRTLVGHMKMGLEKNPVFDSNNGGLKIHFFMSKAGDKK